ncbi:chromosome partition protein Smc [Microlunatus endophyticus]|uniref:Chromosome partition protein Smc n=1 Tax=Microlunatus endophyticus TaxID=1716077 RepID=A0A917SA83_9ACTN|nr:chromosome segregation protein SMC [Microlunatus endophyticus]GGL67290.1 chromosome partition protein Smc [Microlunatus endophyticus]
MYLKSLTLKGFKSFASATTLNFEPGITCVVGPNGSGKSNVVDALSWVMGEQGAKSLRGGKMEDVIFAGTSGRAPLGRAEVILTIDNTDGALPIDYAEVTISRTMFRNGGSDYEINGNKARLLDVQELLSDSGIGREMHVIVGQGQLDSILQATPEMRRGFIEEAAGVLKHRKRKEKALRKLEATETNVNRLNDLVAEVRRQLKPLGRQAEVARKAAVIQAEARDARSRLLADDLVQATLSLESDLADEAQLKQRRTALETRLDAARSAEVEAEETVRGQVPRLNQAQDVWYSLAALRERVASTISIAAERVRNAKNDPGEERRGRDPEELEAEADQVAAQEADLAAEVQQKSEALAAATVKRSETEDAHAAEEKRLAALIRAAADRREGLARLHGQVNSMRSRSEAADEEIGRLAAALQHADERAEIAAREFTALETKVASLDDGESDLDSEHENATERLDELETKLDQLRRDEAEANTERGALAARLEALQLGLSRKDGSAALLAAEDRVNDLLGSVAALVSVESGYEAAVSAAFGAAADAVAVTGLDAAVSAFEHLRAEDLGRAGLLLAGAPDTETVADWPALPAGVRYAAEVVSCRDDLRPAVNRALRKVAVVDDLAAARGLVAALPDVTAVTRDADLLSAHFAAGGSSAQPSLIEVQAAVDEAEQKLAEVTHRCERLRFAQVELAEQHATAKKDVEYALARLHESDAEMAALAEQLGQLNSAARSSRDEASRLKRSITEAEDARDQTATKLAELEERLEAAGAEETDEEPDPAERDRLAEAARLARAAEMESRLALRTVEERSRALSGRADALRRAAENERAARARAQARRERMLREAQVASAVHTAAGYLATRIEESIKLADAERREAEASRTEAEEALIAARKGVRELSAELESLVDTVHRDEMARAERRMRIEALGEKALDDLGVDAATLMRDFGPEVPVPVLTDEDGNALDLEAMSEDQRPEPVPYVRDEQQKRLRKADRALNQLGKINPLALEEYAAMEERHAFLAEQAEDLRKTREDLLSIISDVDARVEQVFAEAYADVEKAFDRVFARLFPGGEGRLVLTEPGDWLNTGVDVEARPAGKKVKRLSLLSGGERSLVAVAFLVSLFIARPSPFYILDEVEAALDDTNLGRLLEIYEELRENSQLLVITHHKRTMEVADALYGVTMRGDGVSAVISQRLREAQESVA